MITAGPKLLAGFMLAPVNLICAINLQWIRKSDHPATGATYRGKMSGGDGEADGQRDGAFDVRSAAVTDAVDDEHENEGDKGFDENALPGWQFRRNGGHAQVADEIRRSCSLKRREKNNRRD